MSTQTPYGFRADVQEKKLTDGAPAFDVAFVDEGNTTTIIAARDEADAFARVEAIKFAFRGLD